LPLAVLASAQLGVPVAAAALGAHGGLLQPGEGGAILGAAVLTLAVAAVGGAYARRPASAATPAIVTAGNGTRADDGGEQTAAATMPVRPSPRIPSASATPATAPTPDTSPTQPALPRKRPAARTKPPAARTVKVANVKTSDPTNVTQRPARATAPAVPLATPHPAAPNPASRPIVQSNVRVQPAPQRAERPPPTRPASRPARSDDDS
jgi:hypothetical protein